jgi:prepilin-type N-terminal cleavage/methylation domain-containing protein
MAAKNSHKGFTLIEIISVLVILGILAAVAIPKYMDLQQQAIQNTLKGAIASAQTRLTWSYANLLLDLKVPTGSLVANEANKDLNCGVSGEQFTITCAEAASGVTITAVYNPTSDSATATWILP